MKVVVLEHGGEYEAWSPDLPGCRGRGATPEKAIRSLQRAAERMLDAYERAGRLLPWAPDEEPRLS